MIAAADIKTCVVHGEPYRQARENARLAEIGGKSQIRDGAERQGSLSIDQLVGIVGHYAASLVLYDSPEPYMEARRVANANPHQGDGGADLPGQVDVKASLIRNPERKLSQYFLPVRPHEMHRDNRYVLALVTLKKEQALVRLMGWAYGFEMPDKPEDEPGHPLRGAYVLKAHQLRPVESLKGFLQFMLQEQEMAKTQRMATDEERTRRVRELYPLLEVPDGVRVNGKVGTLMQAFSSPNGCQVVLHGEQETVKGRPKLEAEPAADALETAEEMQFFEDEHQAYTTQLPERRGNRLEDTPIMRNFDVEEISPA